MPEKHGLLDTLKHLAFEEEPETQKPADSSAMPVTPLASPGFTAPIVPHAPAFDVSPAAAAPLMNDMAGNNEAYQRLLEKTDFESSEAAATIHKFIEPLKVIADSVMPPNVKFKTAVLQAKAQAGLTEDRILATFDQLNATLQREEDAFTSKAQQFAAKEVAGRQERIDQISAQISQLQQELGRLSNELVEAQGKTARAQGQFTAAAHRRRSEIEQQKAQYAAMLKG